MPSAPPTAREIERAIRNIPDFPKPGIQFKDITPVLADAGLFADSIDLLTARFRPGAVGVKNLKTGQQAEVPHEDFLNEPGRFLV